MILEILGGGGQSPLLSLREKEGFLLALTKTRSQWLKFWFVAQRVHPKLRSPFWTDGLLWLRRACNRETMTGVYPNHFLPVSSLCSLNSNCHSRFWLPHRNFLGFCECRRLEFLQLCGNVLFLSPGYANNNFVPLFRIVLAYFSCKQVDCMSFKI